MYVVGRLTDAISLNQNLRIFYRRIDHTKSAVGISFLDFYSSYPTRDNENITDIRSGYFNYLIYYCGIDFKFTEYISDAITKNDNMLAWADITASRLKDSSFNIVARSKKTSYIWCHTYLN